MRKLKFIFLSLFLSAFMVPNALSAQASTAWLEGDGVGIQIEGVQYYFHSNMKHKVITANEIINYVAWGNITNWYGSEDGSLLSPGKYTDSRDAKVDGVRVKLWVFPDGTFMAVAHISKNKVIPPEIEDH